jgi:hypothetical protein
MTEGAQRRRVVEALVSFAIGDIRQLIDEMEAEINPAINLTDSARRN